MDLPFADWFFWESSISRSEYGYRLRNVRELTIPGPSFTATAPGIHCRSVVGRWQCVYRARRV